MEVTDEKERDEEIRRIRFEEMGTNGKNVSVRKNPLFSAGF
jgi:hypothetical protein